MFTWLRRLFTPAKAPDRPTGSGRHGDARRASIDNSKTTDDNRRHWAAADALSARAAYNPGVRQTLRNRSRYECENNGYAGGLIQTLADDMVGVGPRLQWLTEDGELNTAVETLWESWAKQIRNGPAGGLAETLHLMKQSKTRCGDIFGLLSTNDSLFGPVKLDFRLVEAEQVGPPAVLPTALPPGLQDGVELGPDGRPIAYHVYRIHPGDSVYASRLAGDTVRVPASQVIHWFKIKRPGQLRGIPEITSSLGLFAQARRWTLATLSAAEAAADMAVMLTSDSTPADGETDEPTPFETLEIDRGMMVTLPGGMDAKQMAAEHPGTQYETFKHELLKEAGRPVSAPFCVSAGDSSPYNYSSARLDHMLYRQAVRVERKSCEDAVLERLLSAFLEEAVLAGVLPPEVSTSNPHSWQWPGFAAIDPLKESQADAQDLANGTTTLAILLAEKGLDWEEVIRQRGREVAFMREMGLEPAGTAQVADDSNDPAEPVPQKPQQAPRRNTRRQPSSVAIHHTNGRMPA